MDSFSQVLQWLRGSWSYGPPRRARAGRVWWIWNHGYLTTPPPPHLITSDLEQWSSNCEAFSNVRVSIPRPLLQQMDRDGLRNAQIASMSSRVICPYALNPSANIPPMLELPAPYFQFSGPNNEDLTIYCIQPEDATMPVAVMLSLMCSTLGQQWEYPNPGFRKISMVIGASGNATVAHFLDITSGRRMITDMGNMIIQETLTLLCCAVPMSLCVLDEGKIVVAQLDFTTPHAALDIMSAHHTQERLFIRQLFQSALRSSLLALHTLRLLWPHAHMPIPSDFGCGFAPELYRAQTHGEWVQWEGGHVMASILPHTMWMRPREAMPLRDPINTTLLVRAPARTDTGQQTIIEAAREYISGYPQVLHDAGITPQQLGAGVGLYVRSDVVSYTGVLFRIAHIAFNCYCASMDQLPEGVEVDGRPLPLSLAGFAECSQRSAWTPQSVQWGLTRGGREWIQLCLRGALAASVVHRHSSNQGRLRIPVSLRDALR